MTTVLASGGGSGLPMNTVGYVVLALGVALTAAWLYYLYR